AGVQRVFHQFLDHGRGAFDDFAGGDLVDEGVGELADAHPVNLSRHPMDTVRPERSAAKSKDMAMRPPFDFGASRLRSGRTVRIRRFAPAFRANGSNSALRAYAQGERFEFGASRLRSGRTVRTRRFAPAL